jgi:NAD(P)-dependent dehydrogenase (short-subunit alcohol dehydrogenase family)
MDLGLNGKLALVTGSTAGIGAAIAEGLAGERARVILNGRTEDRVLKAMAAIKARLEDAAVEGFAGDLSAPAAAEALAARYPELDILVNNLGIYEPKPFKDISDDDWRRFVEINVLSGARLFPILSGR